MAKFTAKHRVSVTVGGSEIDGVESRTRIDGWSSYEIASSMLQPCDTFTLTRPFDADAFDACRRDAEVVVKIDDVPIITGPIDTSKDSHSRAGSTMTITGRDWVGRLVQESAPTISYDGLDFVEVVRRLADPWFTEIELSDARNRKVRLGKKGRKAAAGDEGVVIKVKKKTWQVEPGQTRWQIMNQLASEAGYMIWASVDGKALVIGQPNYKQGVQFLFTHAPSGSPLSSTVTSMEITESNADRFSLVMALGAGRGDAANYGEATTSRRDIVVDGPGAYGVGRDFLEPKRLILSERALANLDEAKQHAQREKDRRDFDRTQINVTMPGHGQNLGTGAGVALFAPNTIARVINDARRSRYDENALIYSCKYSGSKDHETTEIEAVPSGTVFVQ